MNERTPGPWKLQDLDLHHVYESGTGWEVVGANGETVCDSQQYYPHAVSLPDARLIAAAPILLDDHKANRDDAASASTALNDYLSTVTNDSRLEAARLLMAAVSRRSETGIALASPQESEAKT